MTMLLQCIWLAFLLMGLPSIQTFTLPCNNHYNLLMATKRSEQKSDRSSPMPMSGAQDSRSAAAALNVQQSIFEDQASFETIRSEKGVYIDKTWELYNTLISKQKKYFLLVRPRRFGKSLLCSTLANLFQGRRQLFEGLWITNPESKWDFDAEKRPVLHLDMSAMSTLSLESFRADLKECIQEKTGITLTDAISPGGALYRGVKKLYSESNGKGVVVIIDEYDKPILQNLDEPVAHQECIRKEVQGFYEVLKSLEQELRLVFFTGIFKMNQMSLFSTLNNVIDISFSLEAGSLVGFTEKEIRRSFPSHLTQLAKMTNQKEDELMMALKHRYDGYVFGYDVTGKLSEKVYNSFAICSAFAASNIDDDYWSGSGSDSSLVRKMIFTRNCALEEEIDATIIRQSRPPSELSLPLLKYYGGYYTIKSYSDGMLTLGIPNSNILRSLTVAVGFAAAIQPESEVLRCCQELAALLRQDTPHADDLLQAMNILLANYPYDLFRSEASFRLVIDSALLNCFKKRQVLLEPHTNRGRMDTCLILDKQIRLLEYKHTGTALTAIEQIENKQYHQQFLRQDNIIYAIGVVGGRNSCVVQVAVAAVDPNTGKFKLISSADLESPSG